LRLADPEMKEAAPGGLTSAYALAA
jgi:hypothetical protein